MNIKIARASFCRTAFLAATLLAATTAADAASYAFKVIRAADGDVQTIKLVNTSTGQPVSGVDIEIVHTFYQPHQKGALNIQRTFVPLEDHLRGNCAHPPSDTGAGRELTVMAKVPGEFWPIWGTVDLGD